MQKKHILLYSSLAFFLAFIGLPIYIYLPNYYHNNFGMDLQLIALILLVTRLFDAIQDPFFGYISDKYYKLKKQFIVLLSPLLGISFLFLFYPLASFNIAIWLSISLLITYSLFSMIYINYQSYAVDLSNDDNIKTKIIANREALFILGIVFAAVIPTLLYKQFSEINSFLIIGLLYALLISIFAYIFYKSVPFNPAKSHEKYNFKILYQNSKLKKFFIIFSYNALASAIPASLILFFAEYVLKAPNFIGLFLLVYFVGLFIGVILWTKIIAKTHKKLLTWIISTSFTIISFLPCYFLGDGDVSYFILICLFSGIGFGGDLCIAYLLLTDIIQDDKLKQSETSIFAFASFIIKMSLAISSSILIYFIGFFQDNFVDYQNMFISFSYVIIPIIFKIIALFYIIGFYKRFDYAKNI